MAVPAVATTRSGIDAIGSTNAAAWDGAAAQTTLMGLIKKLISSVGAGRTQADGTPYGATAGTNTKVTATTAAITAVSASTPRKGLILFNGTGQIAKVRLGAAAAADTFTFTMADQESRSFLGDANFKGSVSVILDEGTGPFTVTSLT